MALLGSALGNRFASDESDSPLRNVSPNGRDRPNVGGNPPFD